MLFSRVIDINVVLNPFKPKFPEWYSPSLDLECTIQVYSGEQLLDTDIEY